MVSSVNETETRFYRKREKNQKTESCTTNRTLASACLGRSVRPLTVARRRFHALDHVPCTLDVNRRTVIRGSPIVAILRKRIHRYNITDAPVYRSGAL